MNYAMSDIHGHLNEFKQMLKLINFSSEDHLYILGDIVDKGPDTMGLIKYIMPMQNVTVLLGNHDHMMYTYLKCRMNDDFSDYRRYCNSWLYDNGGGATMEQYEFLSEKEKMGVFDFLSDMVVAIPNLKIADKTFYLVHSMPVREQENVLLMYDTGDEFDDVEEYIWTRWRDRQFFWTPIKGKIVLAGHSINRKTFRIEKKANGYYDIDCGCAINKRLGCLRLEDMQEFYVNCE